MSGLKKKITTSFDRWFTPKEIIIRTGDKVSYLRLSRRLQMGAAGAVSFFILSFLGSSLFSFSMTYLWKERGQHLTEIQKAYSEMLSELKSQFPESELLHTNVDKLASQFTRQMTESQDAIMLMEQKIARLQEDLRRSEIALNAEQKTREQLDSEVVNLAADLSNSRASTKDLQRHLEEAKLALAQSIDGQHQMEMAKNNAENALRDATQRLDDTQSAYSSMLANLTERAHSSVEEMEKTIAGAGLKVEDILSQVDKSDYGQGGPYIPLSDGTVDPGQSVAQHVAPLDDQVTRIEKLHLILRSLPLSAPVDRFYVSSGFGGRADPFNGENGYHSGMDMVGTIGTDVLSTAPGKVIFAGWKGNYGNVVEIDHGFGITTLYAHLKQTLVEVGEEVSYRQKIGLLGNTGRSSGPHVHYEVRYRDRPMNPDKFLQAGRYVFKG